MIVMIPRFIVTIGVGSYSFGKNKTRKNTSSAPLESKKSKTKEKKEENIEETIELNSSNDEEDDLSQEKVLKIPEQQDGIKKYGDIWLSSPSYDQDEIFDSLVAYITQNDIGLDELKDILSNVLIE
jgi:hypothetical protein